MDIFWNRPIWYNETFFTIIIVIIIFCSRLPIPQTLATVVFVSTFLSVKFTYSVQPCIFFKLCCFNSFYKISIIYILLPLKRSVHDSCIPFPSLFPYFWQHCMRFGLPITLTTQTFYLPRRFELPGVNCIIIVVVIITNMIIINNYLYYYY